MKFTMFVQDDKDQAAFNALKETIVAIKTVEVWPYPRLVQEALASRGVDVDMVLEDEQNTVMRVTRRK